MTTTLRRSATATLVAATIALIATVVAHSLAQANDIPVGATCTITEAITAANTDTAVRQTVRLAAARIR